MLAGGGLQEPLLACTPSPPAFWGKGLGDLLLAAVIRFDRSDRPVYRIGAYRRARSCPFVPMGARRRDNAEGLRLAALARGELPMAEEETR